MLSVSNLSVSIASVSILEDVALDVRPGSLTGLMGRNGAGKTTFMRSVMGLIPARSGDIRFEDIDLARQPAHARAGLGIGYMPEDRRLVPALECHHAAPRLAHNVERRSTGRGAFGSEPRSAGSDDSRIDL